MLIFGFYHDAKSTQMNLMEEEKKTKSQLIYTRQPFDEPQIYAFRCCCGLILAVYFSFFPLMTSSHGIRVLVSFFLLLPCERE